MTGQYKNSKDKRKRGHYRFGRDGKRVFIEEKRSKDEFVSPRGLQESIRGFDGSSSFHQSDIAM